MTGPKDQACGPERNGAQPDDAREPAAGQDGAGLDALAEAWIALCQSELAGLASDPEVTVAWRHALGLGAAWVRAAETPWHERNPAARDAGSSVAPGAASPGPAPADGLGDPLRGADAAGLRARIDELERRLAALEQGTAGGGTDRVKPRRRRPSA